MGRFDPGLNASALGQGIGLGHQAVSLRQRREEMNRRALEDDRDFGQHVQENQEDEAYRAAVLEIQRAEIAKKKGEEAATRAFLLRRLGVRGLGPAPAPGGMAGPPMDAGAAVEPAAESMYGPAAGGDAATATMEPDFDLNSVSIPELAHYTSSVERQADRLDEEERKLTQKQDDRRKAADAIQHLKNTGVWNMVPEQKRAEMEARAALAGEGLDPSIVPSFPEPNQGKPTFSVEDRLAALQQAYPKADPKVLRGVAEREAQGENIDLPEVSLNGTKPPSIANDRAVQAARIDVDVAAKRLAQFPQNARIDQKTGEPFPDYLDAIEQFEDAQWKHREAVSGEKLSPEHHPSIMRLRQALARVGEVFGSTPDAGARDQARQQLDDIGARLAHVWSRINREQNDAAVEERQQPETEDELIDRLLDAGASREEIKRQLEARP